MGGNIICDLKITFFVPGRRGAISGKRHLLAFGSSPEASFRSMIYSEQKDTYMLTCHAQRPSRKDSRDEAFVSIREQYGIQIANRKAERKKTF